MKTLRQSEIKPTKEEEEMEEKMVILRQEEDFNQQEEAIMVLKMQLNNLVQVTQEVILIEVNLRPKEGHKEALFKNGVISMILQPITPKIVIKTKAGWKINQRNL